MTDRPTEHQQHDPVGDRIRSALHTQLRAEEARVANGVVSPGRSPRTDRRSPGGVPGRLLIAAAAVVVVAALGIGLAVSRQDGGQRLEAAEDGSTTPVDTTVDDTSDDTTDVTVDDTSGEAVDDTAADPSDAPADDTEVTLVPSDPAAGFTRAGGYAVVQLLDELSETRFVAVDLATGEVDATFFSDILEGTWYSPIELAPSGDALYLARGFDDYWYSCGSFLPDLLRLDLDPDGPIEPMEIGQGAEPRVSPDGTHLAYLASSDCVPDPEDPENWVVAPLDMIVVRDLATGEELSYTSPGIVESIEGGADYRESELRGLVWLDDDRLGVSGGEILNAVDLLPTGESLPVLVETGSIGRTVGADPDTGSILVEVTTVDDEGAATIVLMAVDVATGERSVVRETEVGPGYLGNPFGVDPAGNIIVADGPALLLGDGTGPTLPDRVIAVDW